MLENLLLPPTEISFRSHPGKLNYSVRRWLPSADVSHVIISLDDELIGDTMMGALKALTVGREIEPVAIYSVGFAAQKFGQLHLERGRRYTLAETDKLARVGLPATGEGHHLAAWLESDLLPIINKELPNKKTAPALAGYSLSGLFALQCAILHPGSYSKVAAISPSLFLAAELSEALRSALEKGSLRSIYLAAGGLEKDRELTGLSQNLFQLVENLGTQLCEVNSNSIRTDILAGHTHFSTPSAAAPFAFRHLFST